MTESPPTDVGLRCPHCEYNLTGLPEPRCPECGTQFRWEDVRPEPRIAFEQARGWRRIIGFVQTAATVLFAPWVFGRQIVQFARGRAALAFALACFAGTALALAAEPYFGQQQSPGLESYWAWPITAAAYIPIQAVWLSLLDRGRRGWPFEALRFWCIAGCYTSAIMLTEFLGPPVLTIDDLVDQLSGLWGGRYPHDNLSEPMFSASGVAAVFWLQTVMWLAGVGCCFYARRRRRKGAFAAALTAVLAALSVFALYAAVVRIIGVPLGVWLYPPIDPFQYLAGSPTP